MTETKLPESTTPRSFLTNPLDTIFTANNDTSTGTVREASLGTAIAVYTSIQPYIHTIKQIPGFALLIDFFFPQAKPRIISIYLPSEPTTASRKAQKLITDWINAGKSKHMNLIILGDFNNNLKNKSIPKTTYYTTFKP